MPYHLISGGLVYDKKEITETAEKSIETLNSIIASSKTYEELKLNLDLSIEKLSDFRKTFFEFYTNNKVFLSFSTEEKIKELSKEFVIDEKNLELILDSLKKDIFIGFEDIFEQITNKSGKAVSIPGPEFIFANCLLFPLEHLLSSIQEKTEELNITEKQKENLSIHLLKKIDTEKKNKIQFIDDIQENISFSKTYYWFNPFFIFNDSLNAELRKIKLKTPKYSSSEWLSLQSINTINCFLKSISYEKVFQNFLKKESNFNSKNEEQIKFLMIGKSDSYLEKKEYNLFFNLIKNSTPEKLNLLFDTLKINELNETIKIKIFESIFYPFDRGMYQNFNILPLKRKNKINDTVGLQISTQEASKTVNGQLEIIEKMYNEGEKNATLISSFLEKVVDEEADYDSVSKETKEKILNFLKKVLSDNVCLANENSEKLLLKCCTSKFIDEKTLIKLSQQFEKENHYFRNGYTKNNYPIHAFWLSIQESKLEFAEHLIKTNKFNSTKQNKIKKIEQSIEIFFHSAKINFLLNCEKFGLLNKLKNEKSEKPPNKLGYWIGENNLKKAINALSENYNYLEKQGELFKEDIEIFEKFLMTYLDIGLPMNILENNLKGISKKELLFPAKNYYESKKLKEEFLTNENDNKQIKSLRF